MEIAPTLQALSLQEAHRVQFLITGVGLLSAAYALTKEVTLSRPDFIVQAGIAGTLVATDQLSNVVLIRSECVGDMGVQEEGRFHSLFDLKLASPGAIPWKSQKLVNENSLLNALSLPQADGVTVNEISTSEERIAYYRNELGVQVESMEGAALHYIALQEKIPFLQIRSLSNFIGERDKNKWQLKEAITKLNHQLQHILTKLETQ